MAKPNKTVCGIPVNLAPPLYLTASGSTTVDESKALKNYRYASISKPGARRLADALGVKLPRPGYKVKLCDDQYLAHNGASFDVVREASGDFRGAKRKRRR